MKIHRHLAEEVLKSLQLIFFESQYADKVIERALKSHKKWGSRDRHFFAECTYDLVRHWRYLWALIQKDPSSKLDDLWQLFGCYLYLQNIEIPDWHEFSPLDYEVIKKQQSELKGNRAICESLPDELDVFCFEQLGQDWNLILKSLNQKASVILRTNTLKCSPKELENELAKEDVLVEQLEGYPLAIRLKKRKNVFITQAFKKGYFEVQDASSQMVTSFMDLQSGQRVIDACAGAGGKSLAIAAELQNKGKVIALDIYEWKLKELKKRARRAGVDIIETREINSNKVIKRLVGSADRVLLDVPCSGLGVLRRNPDSKWKLSVSRIHELQGLQREILQRYSKMLKPGGVLIYSTCSILPSENEDQIQWFLQNHKGWVKTKERTFYPHKDVGDGFYICALQKN